MACSSSRRRERHDIIMQILEIARAGSRKTNIMSKAGLSFSQLEAYLNALKREHFITEELDIWKSTEKGVQIIVACKICQDLVKKIR